MTVIPARHVLVLMSHLLDGLTSYSELLMHLNLKMLRSHSFGFVCVRSAAELKICQLPVPGHSSSPRCQKQPCIPLQDGDRYRC